MQGKVFKDIFNSDRKILYVILSVVLISIFSLTIVYAALSVTLNITGNAEVVASSWDVHLDNVQLNSKSATTTAPSITSGTTATFSTTLTNPGDFYEFTIDVVNDGTIDAMIDGITKTPTLTETQAKYLNYVIEYQNGEAISTKQLVVKESFVRLKVRVEYRKDITASELPTTSETLNLAFTVNYVQSDGSGSSVKDDGVYIDPYAVGNEKCFDSECFYVISSTDTTVTMLSKMNITLDNNPKQSSSAGTTKFSRSNYWSSTVGSYPAYVYDSNSILYSYVENYKTYLSTLGVISDEARLITKEEIKSLGFNGGCSSELSWVYATSFWSGTVASSDYIVCVSSNCSINNNHYDVGSSYGVRPVITISKDYF